MGIFERWLSLWVALAIAAGMVLRMSQAVVPWDTLQLWVGLFVVIPLASGWLTRRFLASERAIKHLERMLKPWAIVGLLGTVTLLFGFQAGRIAEDTALIVLVTIPLILQTVLIFLLTALGMRACRQQHDGAAPGALIGAPNVFELAVAVGNSLFGVRSGAALASVVGSLVEEPVMQALVGIANPQPAPVSFRNAMG